MQMHILSDSQHKELTQTLSKLQSILGGSVSVSLDSKPASAPVAKAPAETKPKAVRRKNRRNILNESKVVSIKHRLGAGESAPSIARDFGVAPNVIYSIKYGNTWKNVQLQQDHAPASIDA